MSKRILKFIWNTWNYSGTIFCPLETEISPFPIGFRLKHGFPASTYHSIVSAMPLYRISFIISLYHSKRGKKCWRHLRMFSTFSWLNGLASTGYQTTFNTKRHMCKTLIRSDINCWSCLARILYRSCLSVIL